MSELLKQAFTIIFARGFIRVASIVTFVLIARKLSVEDLGRYGLLVSTITLAGTLGNFGIRQAAASRIGKKLLSDGEAFSLMTLVAPVMTVIAVILAWNLSAKKYLPPDSIGILILFTAIFSSIYPSMLQGIFLGRGEIKNYSILDTIPKVSQALLIVAIYIFGTLSLHNVTLSVALTLALAVPVGVVLALKKSSSLSFDLKNIPSLIGSGFGFALALFLISFSSRVSMFVLDATMGSSASGIYFAVIRVTEIILESASAFGLVIFSHISRSEDRASAMDRSVRIACWFLWSFSLLGLLLALLVPPLLPHIFGSEFGKNLGLAQILLIGLGPAAASKIIYSSVSANGHPLICAVVLVTGLIVNAAICWVFVGHIGINAAAWSFVAGQLIIVIGYGLIVKYKFGIAISKLFIPQRSDFTAIFRAMKNRRRK